MSGLLYTLQNEHVDGGNLPGPVETIVQPREVRLHISGRLRARHVYSLSVGANPPSVNPLTQPSLWIVATAFLEDDEVGDGTMVHHGSARGYHVEQPFREFAVEAIESPGAGIVDGVAQWRVEEMSLRRHAVRLSFAFPYGTLLPEPEPVLRVIGPAGWEFAAECELIGYALGQENQPGALLNSNHGSHINGSIPWGYGSANPYDTQYFSHI